MLTRIPEIIHALEPIKEGEAFFEFTELIESNPVAKKIYYDIECHLSDIEEEQWKLLLPKIVEKFRKHEGDRGWQQAINALQEGIAYSLLKNDGYSEIEFLPRRTSLRTPDLIARRGNAQVTIEVKSINRSEAQIQAQRNMTVQSLGLPLDANFFAKLQSTLDNASEQLAAQQSDEKVIFLFIEFDDSSNEYVLSYLSQIRSWLGTRNMVADKYYIHCHPAFYFASDQSVPPHLIVWP
jgi:Holliday junction resolvase-like predicted endonuclease